MTNLIRPGDRNEQVADVQARLRALGHLIDDDAGYFGESTKSAVRAFQQEREILIDGIVGPDTWTQLVEASWRLGDRTLYLKHPPMRGDDVRTLQGRLNALGFDSGREDGIFGINCDRAVREFQKEYVIAEDGIFGPMTNAALNGLRVDRPGLSVGLREEIRKDQAPGLDQALIVVDPGHGAEDRGIIGSRGNIEADICWQLATRLAERLSYTGARVRFTRTEAEGPDQSTRAERANELGADILISLHLNATEEQTAEGSSTFFFGGSRSGQSVAEKIQEELLALGLRDCRSHPRSYSILRETRMPAVLVEPVFITNADEEKKLEDPEYVRALADAIVRGVRRYYEESL
jgi:N-acetylmuramoyl-L-alanine amidase